MAFYSVTNVVVERYVTRRAPLRSYWTRLVTAVIGSLALPVSRTT